LQLGNVRPGNQITPAGRVLISARSSSWRRVRQDVADGKVCLRVFQFQARHDKSAAGIAGVHQSKEMDPDHCFTPRNVLPERRGDQSLGVEVAIMLADLEFFTAGCGNS